LYQLTYQNNVAYRYNPSTLKINQTLPYFKKMEGWGLTNDGKSLYMSDGSDKIYQLDPKTFKAQRTISVKANGRAVPYINEMEWVNGKIYANVYTTTQVVVINPKTGQVEKVADLKPLQALVTKHPDLDVLNGIAYHPSRKTFFVTGKNWDKMFEIRFK
jgi:glutamine cyclotransferase